MNELKKILKLDFIKAILASLFAAVIFCFCAEMVRCNGAYPAILWIADHTWAFVLGAVAVLMICFAIIWASRRGVFLIIMGLAIFLGSFVNFYKITYRGDPLLPIDFAIALDAAKVAGELHMPLTPSMWLFLGALAVAAIVLWRIKLSPANAPKKAVAHCLTALAVVPVLLVYLLATIWNESVTKPVGIKAVPANAAMSYETSGFVTGYLMYLNDLSSKAPSNYTKEAVLAAKAQMEEAPVSEKADVIVVMLESYYHLSNYEKAQTEEIMESFKRLKTEGVSGYFMSDKYSGGTGDMEFGALTGFSTSFLPTGSIPYSQYVSKRTVPSYVSYLKSLGYSTTAIHPYDGTIYKRSTAYPNMGFEKFITQEQFDKTDIKGMYISDKAVMDKIIQTYEQNKSKGPVFIHAVTMQNHIPNEAGEYGAQTVQASYPNVPQEINDSFASVATGLKDADAAMGYLTDYLKKQSRPCVVLFFGDHQTSIGNFNGTELLDYSTALNNVPAEARVLATHKVPYLMWANYKNENQGVDGDFLPPYMLLAKTTQIYNLPRPAWFNWLATTQQELGGVNLGYEITKDGGLENSFSERQTEILTMQKLLQYDALFGKNYAQ